MLEAVGFDMKNYHEESFGATPPEAKADAVEHAEQAADAPEVDAADLNLVEFIGSDKSIRVAPGETVHAAAAKVGLMIPKACGMGICGTCKVLKLGGEWRWSTTAGSPKRTRPRATSCRAAVCRKGMCGSSTDPVAAGTPAPTPSLSSGAEPCPAGCQVRNRATRPLRSTARRDNSALAALV
jgi:ferredoxin